MLCSQVRECLKLDQDDKECFAHYKQVKKLSKQLDSAEELISEHRCVLCSPNHSYCTTEVSQNFMSISRLSCAGHLTVMCEIKLQCRQ